MRSSHSFLLRVFSAKALFLLLLLANSAGVYAQVGIGTPTPDPSAILELQSTSQGFLLPRMNATQMNAIPSPLSGLMVFNTTAGEAFYYDGTTWSPVAATAAAGWNLTGNAGTSPATDYIGTSDAQPLVFRTDGNEQMRLDVNGNLGIGATSPQYTLEVAGDARFELGTSTTEGLLVTGTFAAGSSVPNLGGGSRMMFYPGKSAFRAGRATATEWNDASVGDYSAAFGLENEASGSQSFAAGGSSVASGEQSIALGGANEATNTYAVALVHEAEASGFGAFAAGGFNEATGDYSTAVGGFTVTESAYEFAAGIYNTTYLPNNPNGYDPDDRVFVVGNGTGPATRSDALRVLKNGNMAIGNLNPTARLHVGGDFRLQTGTAVSEIVDSTALSALPNGNALQDTMLLSANAISRLISDSLATVGGLTHFTESLTTGTDSASVWQPSIGTNVGVVISPRGTGYIAADVPDGMVNGGEARGDYAVDLQFIRSNAPEVASGDAAVISGGFSNTASALGATVGGGQDNTASDFNTTIAGGQANTASSSYATVGGGFQNTAGGSYSAIPGGYDLRAQSFGEVALGTFNDTLTGGFNPTSFAASDRLLTIGNGPLASNRSNALVMLKNGNTTLNGQLTLSDGANPFTLPNADGTNGQVLVTDGTGNVSWQAAPGGLTHFVETAHTGVDAGAVWNPDASVGSDAGIILQPNGVGYIAADRPDGFDLGGDARGNYAVDLQMERSIPGEVASGFYAVISGGRQNTASSSYATVGGGLNNTASGSSATVGGGSSNTASGGTSTVSGGGSNTASGSSATVGGGIGNTASGTQSTLSGGRDNTAGGVYSTIPGGFDLRAQSYGEVALGTFNDTLTGGFDPGSFVATDRLLTIGNGQFGSRSNALVMLKNGNTGIGVNNPGHTLDVGGDLALNFGTNVNQITANSGTGTYPLTDDNLLTAAAVADYVQTNASPWTDNTANGIEYNSGTVGIGIDADNNTMLSVEAPAGTAPQIELMRASATRTNRLTDAGMSIGSGNGFISVGTGFDLNFQVSGATQMVMQSDGNVGIGDLTPNATLDVDGNFRLNNSTPVSSIETSMPGTPTNDQLLTAAAIEAAVGGGGEWQINPQGIDYPGGNVGIGNNNPQYQLDVTGRTRLEQPSGVNAQQPSLRVTNTAGVTTTFSTAYKGGEFIAGSNTNDNKIALRAVSLGDNAFSYGLQAEATGDDNSEAYGVFARAQAGGSPGNGNKYGVYGEANGGLFNYGGRFETNSSTGNQNYGLYASANSNSAISEYGIYARSIGDGANSYGIYGFSDSPAGTSQGVHGRAHNSTSTKNTGVYGYARDGSDETFAFEGRAFNSVTAGTGRLYGVFVQTDALSTTPAIAGYGFRSTVEGADSSFGARVDVISDGSTNIGYYAEVDNATDESYGAYVDVLSTGSGPNYGYYVDVNGGSSNYAIYANSGTSWFRGNVGIGSGNTSPSEALQVQGNVYADGGDFYSAASNGVINCAGGIMINDVNVMADGIGNMGQAGSDEDLYIQGALEVDGNAFKSTLNWSVPSDRRMKHNIRNYEAGLDEILQVKTYRFRYREGMGIIDTDRDYIGIIAQELAEIAPYMIDTIMDGQRRREMPDGTERIVEQGTERLVFNGSAFTFMTINAIQQQQRQIDELSQQLNAGQQLTSTGVGVATQQELDALGKQVNTNTQRLQAYEQQIKQQAQTIEALQQQLEQMNQRLQALES